MKKETFTTSNPLKEINALFKSDAEFWCEGKLDTSFLIEAIKQKKIEVINRIMQSEVLKKLYFTDVDGVTIFHSDELCQLLRYKKYWKNGFTKYQNIIGLTCNDTFLNHNLDVVLDFPFKDCVLKGDANNEVFYHEIMDKEHIDCLFAEKVFTNVMSYPPSPLLKIEKTSNLLIKGNGLVALHSIKSNYSEMVKLIYIKAPAIKNGEFNHNKGFGCSTWLIYMKNRLEAAKSLLNESGSVFINCDNAYFHYLKVLADSIFNEDNFVCDIVWQTTNTKNNSVKIFHKNHCNILVYAKNKEFLSLNGLPRTEAMNKRYNNPDNHPKGKWRASPLHAKKGKDDKFSYTFKNGITWQPPLGYYSRFSRETLKSLDENNEIWFGYDGNSIPSKKTFLADLNTSGLPFPTIWTYKDIDNSSDTNNATHNEKIIQRILHIGSNPNDIVLDFHLGGGELAFASHKMGRQYIGIEQTQSINEIVMPKLKNIIDEDIKRNKGGPINGFIYFELKSLNLKFMHKINNAKTKDDIKNIIEEMIDNAYINYQVNIESILCMKNKKEERQSFTSIPLSMQKRILLNALDNNQLYVNYSEIDDASHEVSEMDKLFTHSFYNK